jgi:hypothetical protein
MTIAAAEPGVNLTARSRILAVIIAAFFFLLVLELVRRRRLQERYTVLWFILASGMIVGAAVPGSLELLARLIGARNTNVALFALLLLLLLALAFDSTVSTSTQSEKITRLAQDNALLRLRVTEAEQKLQSQKEDDSPALKEKPGANEPPVS